MLSARNSASAQTLNLQLSCSTLTFAVTSPLSHTDVPANENPVSATVTYGGAGTVHIFMIASGDLLSSDGSPSIPASDVYWTASGLGYESGTMSAAQQVEASSGSLATGASTGWHFFLKHSLFETGSYQISITVMAIAQ